jgi:hypothetical protein
MDVCPLTDLLKKGAIYVWTYLHHQSFVALKHAITSAPVLVLPDFSQPFTLETDASGTGVGAVLMQQGHPLAFMSKSLSPRLQGLSTYEKEYLAILMAVEQWRSYLQHAEFHIITDHKSLMQLSEQRLHTPWQQKVFTRLLGLQYRIIYRKGIENGVADALSRVSSPLCSAISVIQPQWLKEVLLSYQGDPQAQDFLARLTNPFDEVPHYSLHDGIIHYDKQIWIGSSTTLRSKLIAAMHSGAVGGHSGVPVTYRRMKQHFAWTGMKADVHDFVTACQVCQQAKPDRSKLPELLQPLPVPDHAWKIVSLDFIEGLPVSEGFNCILVVVELFSKYAHFIGLRHPFTAASIAKVFFQTVYKLHGMPSALISDRDKIFTSTLWKELFKLAKVELHMSTAYHPQSDGQTERVNQCLETFLRCFASVASVD